MNERIYCQIRKKYVALTAEEQVRQRTISILVNDFHYPLTRFSVEAAINVGLLDKRYDIVVRSYDMTPFMLIECKAPYVKISNKTIDQACGYNITLKAKYILLTNGQTTILLRLTNKGYVQQKTIPHLLQSNKQE